MASSRTAAAVKSKYPDRSPSVRALGFMLRAPEAGIAVVCVLLAITFGAMRSAFLSNANLQTVSQFVAPWAILACGEIMLLICGEVDLSVGQVFAMAPFVMNAVYMAGIPFLLAVLVALGICAFLGFCIGVISVVFRVPSFITTLGALLLFNGLTLTLSGAFPVNTPNTLLAPLFGGWEYSQIIWAVVIAVLMHGLLRHTSWGLHTVAVGGNTTGAAEAGIHVRRIKIGNFILCSVLGGFAGIINAFHVTSIDPNAGGSNVMFLAIASSVIGGTSLMGGSGTVLGGLAGAAVLGILQDGFTLLGVNAFAFDIITGAAILLTMIANVQFADLRRKRRI
jgi:simple sugar transport system permease protein